MEETAGSCVDADDLLFTVVNGIADHRGCNPIEVSPRLSDVINPDALSALARFEGVAVTFEHGALEVRASGSEGVSITGRTTVGEAGEPRARRGEKE